MCVEVGGFMFWQILPSISLYIWFWLIYIVFIYCITNTEHWTDKWKYIPYIYLAELRWPLWHMVYVIYKIVGGTQRFIDMSFFTLEFFFPSWVNFFLLWRIAITSLWLPTFAITTLMLHNLCIAWKSCFSSNAPATLKMLSMAASRSLPVRFLKSPTMSTHSCLV